jgi:uncharacterized radical SAM superfamily protein
MADASSPALLHGSAAAAKASGRAGVLLSGGCDDGWRVPVSPEACAAASGMGLDANVHAGFAPESGIAGMVAAGARVFSVDVHQDPEVIRGVLGSDRRPGDYGALIRSILSAGGVPVPHVTAGLGERDLLESASLLRSMGFRRAVLLGLVPSGRARFSGPSVPSAVELLGSMGIEAALGCMRDRSSRSMERECIERGARLIANMSPRTAEWARGSGFAVEEDPRCCCMPLSEKGLFGL